MLHIEIGIARRIYSIRLGLSPFHHLLSLSSIVFCSVYNQVSDGRNEHGAMTHKKQKEEYTEDGGEKWRGQQHHQGRV